MILAEMRPSDDDPDINDIQADINYDWSLHLAKYSKDQLDEVDNWIEKQKIYSNDISNNSELYQ